LIRVVPLSSLYLFDFDPNTGTGVAAPSFALGIQVSDQSVWWHAGPVPLQWDRVGTGSGGGGGGSVVAIEYVVGGGETDLSEIVIPVSPPMPSANYGVVGQCQGCVGIVGMDIPDDQKSTTQFKMIATGALQPGDRLMFFLSPIVTTVVGPAAVDPEST
jgi:hypothetical protein